MRSVTDVAAAAGAKEDTNTRLYGPILPVIAPRRPRATDVVVLVRPGSPRPIPGAQACFGMVRPACSAPTSVLAVVRAVQPGVPRPVPEERANAGPGPIFTLVGRCRDEEPPVATSKAEVPEMAAPARASPDTVVFVAPTRVGDAPPPGPSTTAAADGPPGDDAPFATTDIPVLLRRPSRPREGVMRQIVRVPRPSAPWVAAIPARKPGREDAPVPVETISVELTGRVVPAVEAEEVEPGSGPVGRPRKVTPTVRPAPTVHHARVGVEGPVPIPSVAPDRVPLGHTRPATIPASGALLVTEQTPAVRSVAVPTAGSPANEVGLAPVLAMVAQVGQEA